MSAQEQPSFPLCSPPFLPQASPPTTACMMPSRDKGHQPTPVISCLRPSPYVPTDNFQHADPGQTHPSKVPSLLVLTPKEHLLSQLECPPPPLLLRGWLPQQIFEMQQAECRLERLLETTPPTHTHTLISEHEKLLETWANRAELSLEMDRRVCTGPAPSSPLLERNPMGSGSS